jgi:methyl-accepting chemotaxis protein
LKIQDQIKMQLIIWMVISVIVGLLIGWVVSRSIVKPLKQLVDAANQIADGDLRQQVAIRQKDEIGLLAATFNRMIENIKGLLMQVDEISSRVASFSEELRANAETTAHASEQIAATTIKTAEGVEQQAGHVAVTKETIGEMRTGLDHIVNNIEEVVQQSESTNQATETGAMAVTKAVGQMKTIQDSTREAGQAVEQLQTYAQKITKVIELINNIARQTNLLSLNASIEAARAGEAGRGFAVVANEIRSLSAQTTSATSEIETVIGQILNEIRASAEKMKTGENQVELGMTEIDHVNEAFDRIKEAIQQLTGKIEEVSGTVEEMAAGSEQVVQSMDVVDEHAQSSLQAVKEIASSAQQQTASMEEVTAASADLAESAQQLREVLERFKI